MKIEIEVSDLFDVWRIEFKGEHGEMLAVHDFSHAKNLEREMARLPKLDLQLETRPVHLKQELRAAIVDVQDGGEL